MAKRRLLINNDQKEDQAFGGGGINYTTNELLANPSLTYTNLTTSYQEFGDRILVNAADVKIGDLLEYESIYSLSNDSTLNTSGFLFSRFFASGLVASGLGIGLASSFSNIVFKTSARILVTSNTVLDIYITVEYSSSNVSVATGQAHKVSFFIQKNINDIDTLSNEFNFSFLVNDVSGTPKMYKINSSLKIFTV